MNQQYAIDVINELYLEGERDYIFLEQIIGLIRYDSKDESRGKSELEVCAGSRELIEFLIGSGDFELVIGDKSVNGEVEFKSYNGEIGEIIRALLNPVSADSFQYRIVLQKRMKGAMSPTVPTRIIELLA